MERNRALTRLAVVVAAIGAVFALVTAVAGVELAGSYRPHASGVRVQAASVREAHRSSDWQLYASIGFLVAALVTLIVTWTLRRAASGSRVAVGLAAAATAAAVTVLWTRPMVQWDQLALWAVTVGTNADGYWFAAFDDGVRFVLIDGAEISQGQYAPVAIAHVAAPVLGVVALTAVGVVVVRTFRSWAGGGSPATPATEGAR